MVNIWVSCEGGWDGWLWRGLELEVVQGAGGVVVGARVGSTMRGMGCSCGVQGGCGGLALTWMHIHLSADGKGESRGQGKLGRVGGAGGDLKTRRATGQESVPARGLVVNLVK